MLDKTKTDSKLGIKIHQLLLDEGIETPMKAHEYGSDENRLELIRVEFENIMNILGLDLEDDSLNQTPNRVAKMFLNEIYWGLNYNNFPKMTTIRNKMKVDEMVAVRSIPMNSNCEHHFVPIIGNVSIAYVPRDKVLGLSKFNRIVEFFSRRPQVQERLTEQIFTALKYILETDDMAVIVEGVHTCVLTRGVEHSGVDTVTSKLGGSFKDNSLVRSEFFKVIESARKVK